jgi:hypothetical protein
LIINEVEKEEKRYMDKEAKMLSKMGGGIGVY